MDVLQSQLFVLRLLSACMQHHWKTFREQSRQRLAEGANVALSPEAAAAAEATGAIGSENEFLQAPVAMRVTPPMPDSDAHRYSTSSSSSHSGSVHNRPYQGRSTANVDPPPLDEALVTFLLALVGRFLNQTHLIEEASDQLASTPSDHPAATLATVASVDTKVLEIVIDIYKTAGRVLYYVSASNWPIYYGKIKNAVHILGAMGEGTEMNPPEIRMLACSCLNRQRLHTILSGKLLIWPNCARFLLTTRQNSVRTFST